MKRFCIYKLENPAHLVGDDHNRSSVVYRIDAIVKNLTNIVVLSADAYELRQWQ